MRFSTIATLLLAGAPALISAMTYPQCFGPCDPKSQDPCPGYTDTCKCTEVTDDYGTKSYQCKPYIPPPACTYCNPQDYNPCPNKKCPDCVKEDYGDKYFCKETPPKCKKCDPYAQNPCPHKECPDCLKSPYGDGYKCQKKTTKDCLKPCNPKAHNPCPSKDCPSCEQVGYSGKYVCKKKDLPPPCFCGKTCDPKAYKPCPDKKCTDCLMAPYGHGYTCQEPVCGGPCDPEKVDSCKKGGYGCKCVPKYDSYGKVTGGQCKKY